MRRARQERLWTPARWGAVAAVCAVCVGALVACGGGGARSAGAPGDAYIEQYKHGQYLQAKAGAEKKMASSSGLARDQAALIAGLSAQAEGQRAEAKRLLRPLLTHGDRELAGRAGAALGLIAQEEGDKRGAADLLTEAASKLTGDEAAKAAMYGGDMLLSLGRKEAANAQYASGMRTAVSESLKGELRERLAGWRFTVQLGAFSSFGNAERRAGQVRETARTGGAGEPRILTEVNKGKTMYTVQVGEFVSRQEAAAVKTRLGLEGQITRLERN
jgi:tetratricopeptide (TPR) repeat protein